MKPIITLLSLAALTCSVRAEGPDFVKEIAPILEASCVKCHCEAKVKGKLRMDTKEMAMKGGKDNKLILPGNPKTVLSSKCSCSIPRKTKRCHRKARRPAPKRPRLNF